MFAVSLVELLSQHALKPNIIGTSKEHFLSCLEAVHQFQQVVTARIEGGGVTVTWSHISKLAG
jgi:hypothetical protein